MSPSRKKMGKNFDRSYFKFKEVVNKFKIPIFELTMIQDILAHHHVMRGDARVALNKRATTKTGSRSCNQADKTYSPATGLKFKN